MGADRGTHFRYQPHMLKLLGKVFVLGFLPFIAGMAIFAWGTTVASNHLSAGDWPSFAGGVIGSGLAVIGSVFVFSLQRIASRRDQTALMLETLRDMLDSVRTMGGSKQAGTNAEQQTAILAAVRRYQDARKTLEIAVKNTLPIIRTPAQFVSIDRVLENLKPFDDQIAREDYFVTKSLTDAVLAAHYANMAPLAGELAPIIERAITAYS